MIRATTSANAGTEYYEVEEILARRWIGTGDNLQSEYYVKWKGYPHSENSWEPREYITDDLLEEADKRYPGRNVGLSNREICPRRPRKQKATVDGLKTLQIQVLRIESMSPSDNMLASSSASVDVLKQTLDLTPEQRILRSRKIAELGLPSNYVYDLSEIHESLRCDLFAKRPDWIDEHHMNHAKAEDGEVFPCDEIEVPLRQPRKAHFIDQTNGFEVEFTGTFHSDSSNDSTTPITDTIAQPELKVNGHIKTSSTTSKIPIEDDDPWSNEPVAEQIPLQTTSSTTSKRPIEDDPWSNETVAEQTPAKRTRSRVAVKIEPDSIAESPRPLRSSSRKTASAAASDVKPTIDRKRRGAQAAVKEEVKKRPMPPPPVSYGTLTGVKSFKIPKKTDKSSTTSPTKAPTIIKQGPKRQYL